MSSLAVGRHNRIGRDAERFWSCCADSDGAARQRDHRDLPTSYDTLGRPTLVQEAAGKAESRTTQTQYEDHNRRVIVKKDLNTGGDGLLVTVTDYDQLDRPALSRQLESASGSVDDDTVGIKVQTRYMHPAGASYKLVSNPYRAAQSSAAGGESTMGWTLSSYDPDGRVTAVQSFIGAALPAPWGSNTSTTGTTTTSYSAATTTVTDQAGKARALTVDGVGRLAQVVEDPGSSPHLAYLTSYAYNALDDLTSVTQGSQTRTFAYDSLKRLSQAVNPESGTISYTYDSDGNVLTKTDSRSIVTSFGTGTTCSASDNSGYDCLNRPVKKTYSDGTATVTWTWDTKQKGQLTSIDNSVGSFKSTTSFGGYDGLGRATSSSQNTGTQTYGFSYTYLPVGLATETYPSARKLTLSYDGAGRLAGVSGALSGVTTPYARGLVYAAQGALSGMTLGSGKYEETCFNSRLQPTGIRVGTAATGCANSSDLLNLAFGYGSTNNNGNLTNDGIVASGGANVTQSFVYDGVNRLSTGSEVANSTTTWSRAFSYDQWGNMCLSGAGGLPGVLVDSTTPQTSVRRPVERSVSLWGRPGRFTTLRIIMPAS